VIDEGTHASVDYQMGGIDGGAVVYMSGQESGKGLAEWQHPCHVLILSYGTGEILVVVVVVMMMIMH